MTLRGLFASCAVASLGLWLWLAGVQGAQAADPAAGKEKAKLCQTCHGIDGLAKIPTAPHLAGESQVYLATQLRAFRSGTRTHEIMSLIAKNLSDEDIENLAAWYSSIQIEVRMPE